MLICLALASAQAQKLTPPPPPSVPPQIGLTYETDADKNRIDDELDAQWMEAVFGWLLASTEAQIRCAQEALTTRVEVELIFKAPVSQAQIDAFVAEGGEITHLYKAVSYGWNGLIALEKIPCLPGRMGPQLVLVAKPRQVGLTAGSPPVRIGRIRPARP